jgi:hypothetical protein
MAVVYVFSIIFNTKGWSCDTDKLSCNLQKKGIYELRFLRRWRHVEGEGERLQVLAAPVTTSVPRSLLQRRRGRSERSTSHRSWSKIRLPTTRWERGGGEGVVHVGGGGGGVRFRGGGGVGRWPQETVFIGLSMQRNWGIEDLGET